MFKHQETSNNTIDKQQFIEYLVQNDLVLEPTESFINIS